ncbi:DUF885 domain-containing protein [Roseivirga sp. E12]|uniref:DUF885 domain-containing protein n=1 Tax=Roseivirga sp. E12 TaxID=2819237 RepID=UPI001ABC1591|nr:DUF885 domain-containing protein [Roseivirga sp. E12]MBO3697140.1 DUF885 domain-containing protein [Roseivirga sp. E12]
MIKRFALTLLLSLVISPIHSFAQNANMIDDLLSDYKSVIRNQRQEGLQIDYKAYINSLFNISDIEEQKTRFQSIDKGLKSIDTTSLSQTQLFDYRFLNFEVSVQLEKIRLIELTKGIELRNQDKVFDYSHGYEWYEYLIKKWTGTTLTIEQIYNLGLTEVDRVKAEISALNLKQAAPKSNFTNNESAIEKLIARRLQKVENQFDKLLPRFSRMPSLSVSKGRNRALAQTPAYYSNNTFYYNLFDKPFNLSDIDFLLIHEGIPGHHYQRNYHQQLDIPEHVALSSSMGFVEGWAAYTENLGWELGLYETPYEELSKWNWDLIRSARVVMDVGLNYHGWSDDKALSFWKEHIKDQDDIALREINRMKRWPAQVLTYKLGDVEIRRALDLVRASQLSNFDYLKFHTHLLSKGPIPVHLISILMKDII